MTQAEALDWLRARLGETEESTRAVLVEAQRAQLALKEPRLLGRVIPGWHTWPEVEQMAQDMLANVDSKRCVLDEVEEHWDSADPIGHLGCLFLPAPWRRVLCLLAQPYADQPGFPDELRLP